MLLDTICPFLALSWSSPCFGTCMVYICSEHCKWQSYVDNMRCVGLKITKITLLPCPSTQYCPFLALSWSSPCIGTCMVYISSEQGKWQSYVDEMNRVKTNLLPCSSTPYCPFLSLCWSSPCIGTCMVYISSEQGKWQSYVHEMCRVKINLLPYPSTQYCPFLSLSWSSPCIGTCMVYIRSKQGKWQSYFDKMRCVGLKITKITLLPCPSTDTVHFLLWADLVHVFSHAWSTSALGIANGSLMWTRCVGLKLLYYHAPQHNTAISCSDLI